MGNLAKPTSKKNPIFPLDTLSFFTATCEIRGFLIHLNKGSRTTIPGKMERSTGRGVDLIGGCRGEMEACLVHGIHHMPVCVCVFVLLTSLRKICRTDSFCSPCYLTTKSAPPHAHTHHTECTADPPPPSPLHLHTDTLRLVMDRACRVVVERRGVGTAAKLLQSKASSRRIKRLPVW